jgi:hypothetical protein
VLSNTKLLLIVSALAELGLGVALLIVPSLTAEIVLGAGLASAVSVLVARVCGAALLSIALSCWFERNRGGPSGLVAGLAVYNAVVAALLSYAAVVDGMEWPRNLAGDPSAPSAVDVVRSMFARATKATSPGEWWCS